MKPRNYKDWGIVLSRKNHGETDRLLAIYTKNHGKLHFLAKGIRGLKSRKKGHLEVFSNISFSAVSISSLDILSEVETLNNFSLIRTDLKKAAVAYFFLETLTKLTREGEKHQEVYDLLVDYLEKLQTTDNTRQLRHQFTAKILITLGFWPQQLPMNSPDSILEDVIERKLNTVRIGKKLLS